MFILLVCRNLEKNPLLCRCENKWIQEGGLNRNRNRLPDQPWPRITLSSFPRLTCKDSNLMDHQLQSFKFERCGILAIFPPQPLLIFMEVIIPLQKNQSWRLVRMTFSWMKMDPLVLFVLLPVILHPRYVPIIPTFMYKEKMDHIFFIFKGWMENQGARVQN